MQRHITPWFDFIDFNPQKFSQTNFSFVVKLKRTVGQARTNLLVDMGVNTDPLEAEPVKKKYNFLEIYEELVSFFLKICRNKQAFSD